MAQRTFTLLLGTQAGDVHKADVSVTFETASAGTNGIKKADYRFDDGGLQRTIFGGLQNGAAVDLYVYPIPGNTTIKHLETTISVGSSSYTSATNSFSDVLNGPFWAVEAVMISAVGSAWCGMYL